MRLVLLLVLTLGSPILSFAVGPQSKSDGAAMFSSHCMLCHGPAGRAPQLPVLSKLKRGVIEEILTHGMMRQQAAGLSPDDIRSIANYITASQAVPQAGALKTCSAKPPMNEAGEGDWANWSPTSSNSRFQPDPGLASSDVRNLRLKWALVFPGAVSASNPVTVVGGRLFVGSWDGTIYSLNAATGCSYWTFKADAGVRTAIAIKDKTVFFGDFGANVYAIDEETGSLKWKTKVDFHPYARITASLAIDRTTVFVPVSSLEEGVALDPTYSCCTFRGSVVALDSSSGKLIWKTHTIEEEPKSFGVTKKGVTRLGPSGAAVWNSPTVDTKRGVVYVATGNSYSGMDNPASDAVIAFDLKSGAKRWTKTLRPSDQWNASCMGERSNCPESEGPDYDFGATTVLAHSNNQDLLLAGQKSGMLYALDPENQGDIVWQTRVGEGGSFGGIEWGFSADAGRAYVAISDMDVAHPKVANGSMVAVDLANGKLLWRTPNRKDLCLTRPETCSNALVSAVAAIPGVAFEGSHDGFLRAYDAATGKVIWEYDTAKEVEGINGVKGHGGSISGAGATVAGGQVYQTTGYAAYGLGMPGNALLVFAPAGSITKNDQQKRTGK